MTNWAHLILPEVFKATSTKHFGYFFFFLTNFFCELVLSAATCSVSEVQECDGGSEFNLLMLDSHYLSIADMFYFCESLFGFPSALLSSGLDFSSECCPESGAYATIHHIAFC